MTIHSPNHAHVKSNLYPSAHICIVKCVWLNAMEVRVGPIDTDCCCFPLSIHEQYRSRNAVSYILVYKQHVCFTKSGSIQF